MNKKVDRVSSMSSQVVSMQNGYMGFLSIDLTCSNMVGINMMKI